MRRPSSLVTVMLVLALVVVACGGEATPAAAPEGPTGTQAQAQPADTEAPPTEVPTEEPAEAPSTAEDSREEPETAGEKAAAMADIYKKSPWWPYLSAHANVDSPPDLIGGPIELRITQDSGGANWVFPGLRKLDPAIFGTTGNPKATEVPPPLPGCADAGPQTAGGRHLHDRRADTF